MPDAVPYQAYKSKRHSHTLSNSNHTNLPHAPLTSFDVPRSPSPSPQVPNKYSVLDKEKEKYFVYARPAEASPPPPHPVIIVGHETNSTFNPQDECNSSSRTTTRISPPNSSNAVIMSATPLTSSSLEIKSSPPKDQLISPPQPPRKSSTFRRVPLHNSRQILPLLQHGPTNHLRTSSLASSDGGRSDASLSSSSRKDPRSRHFSMSSIVPSIPARPIATSVSESKSASVESVPQTTTQIPSIEPPISTGPHNNSLGNRSTPKTPPPYHPDFQPRGVTRSQTDKFLVFRRVKLEGQGEDGSKSGRIRVERTKLERRLEKLIHLHFPAESRGETEVERRRPGVGVAEGGETRRTSSFFDFDIRNMSIPDAGVLLRGVLGASETNGDVRAAEQRITPWQDDISVSKCPICAAVFHPLTTRKHHCRLCGQIICSLPPKRPQRQDTCSLLFVVDPKTRMIEQVGEGVDYGVRRRGGWNADGGRAPLVGSYKNVAEEDKFLKGVRICRLCRPVLLRQQHLQEITHVPTLMKLYDMFLRLELEIKESLPQFQELILTLSQEDQPTKDASATRKRLLQAFAQYDQLAKRIRQLPSNGPGSSQDRVQMAVMARASLFLQKNMFPLQSLPTKRGTESPTLNTNTNDTNTHHLIDSSSLLALTLQPLLEQEALLESFVEEAEARRKFEDVKTLKANLQEIRAEIQKIIVNSKDGIQGGADGSG